MAIRPRIEDVEEYRRACVKLDRTDLLGEMARISGDIGYWGEKLAEARQCAAEAALRADVSYARLYAEHREALRVSGAKVTEDGIESAVLRDPEYAEMVRERISADRVADDLRYLLNAVEAKAEMLVQYGAQARVEMKVDSRSA